MPEKSKDNRIAGKTLTICIYTLYPRTGAYIHTPKYKGILFERMRSLNCNTLLGGLGACSPRNVIKSDAIRCILECFLTYM